MRSSVPFGLGLWIAAIAATSACSTRGGGRTVGDDDAGFIPSADAGVPIPDSGTPPPPVDAGTPPEDDVLVWAHSGTELFAFDPRRLVVSTIGRFNLAGGGTPTSMTDIAVTRNGDIYGCSSTALYLIDTASARCTLIAEFTLPRNVQFNGLTFLPAGTLDPLRETLVGATSAGDFYRVDTITGEATKIGTYSDGYLSSGDIVSVQGAGTFATVKRADLENGDLLVRLDPATGRATPIGTGTGYSRLFGLGYWRNRVFGFSAAGELVTIDLTTGRGSLATDMTGTSQFYGAGVKTDAPVF